MEDNDQRIKFLSRRVGSRWIPIIGLNLIIPGAFLKDALSKNPVGLLNGIHNILNGKSPAAFFLLVVIIPNIIPALYIYSIFAYRVGYDHEAIYARPFPRTGPYMRMPFADVERVELFSFARLYKALGLGYPSNLINKCANIRLYRKHGDKREIFLINSSQLHGKQLKALVRMIYDRCPTAFSEDVRRYLESDRLYPPNALAEKNGHPVYKW
jgi:hypothetical protein